LILAGGLVLGRNMDNRIGVNVEADLDLSKATMGRRNTNKLEVTKELVITNQLALTLVNFDIDSGLEIGSSREN